MGFREILQKNQALAAVGAVVFIAAMVFLIFRNSTNEGGGFAEGAFYSDDDGKSYFTDSRLKAVPFDRAGKPAVKAHVYRCKGETSVHYLERYTEAGRKAVEESLNRSGGKEAVMPEAMMATEIEFKRPGEGAWSTRSPGPKKCPDGSPAEWVTP